jgi:acetyl esterase/lipase
MKSASGRVWGVPVCGSPSGRQRPAIRAGSVGAAWISLALLFATVASSGGAQQTSDYVHQYSLFLNGPDGTTTRVLVTYPRRADGQRNPPGERYPVVVALHGRGESVRGYRRGSLAWSVDYELPSAFGALAGGPLAASSYRSFVEPAHLALVNRQLAAKPYRGVFVVAPFVPDLMADDVTDEDVAAYGRWVAGPMLEAVRSEYPQAATTAAATGIDGVSLGGMVALEVGLAHPEAFGAVGAIQPAIRGRVERYASAALATARAHGAQRIRLLTSEDDPFREPTRALSTALRDARVPHRFVEMPGPHGYEFNRGPGALELLRFAEEVLATEPAPE